MLPVNGNAGRMSLERLLRPRSIAVIGASPNSFIGSAVLTNLTASGYSGSVVAVNPNHGSVAGYAAVSSIDAIDASIDLAVIQIGARGIATAIDESLSAGITNFVIPGVGHTDSGSTANGLISHLKNLRDSHGIAVVGPNSMGIVDLVSGAQPYVGSVPQTIRRGHVAVLSQSGAIAEAIVNSGGRVPLSTVVSTGSEATTDLADYLCFFASDPETSAILVFAEGLQRPDCLLAALAACENADKRVGVLVVGRSETAQDGIVSHSGRLAPDYRVTRAALKQAGAVLADDLDELIALGELFGAGISDIGPRAMFTVNSGGEGNLIADLAADAGLILPPLSAKGSAVLEQEWPNFSAANPLDPWGAADYKDIYPAALKVAANEDVDTVIVAQDQQTTCGAYEQELGHDLAMFLHAACSGTTKTPIFLSPASQDPPQSLAEFCHRKGIALLRGARPSLHALSALSSRTPHRVAEACVHEYEIADITHIDGIVEEDDALSVLESAGVDTPYRRRTTSHLDAVAAAHDIGYPVVVKGAGIAAGHKTELNLVHPGIHGPDALSSALEAIDAQSHVCGTPIDYLVEQHVEGAIELIIGFHRDPSFGPTTIVGLGGVWAEALNSVAIHVGDLDRCAAVELIEDSGIGALLRTNRSGALASDAVIETLLATARVGRSRDDISSIDLNPVIVGADRAVAVDALITINSKQQEGCNQ
jgi:acetate---CoA ligase (ADP-forming)